MFISIINKQSGKEVSVSTWKRINRAAGGDALPVAATRTMFLVRVDTKRLACKVADRAWRSIKYVEVCADRDPVNEATDLQLQNLRRLLIDDEDNDDVEDAAQVDCAAASDAVEQDDGRAELMAGHIRGAHVPLPRDAVVEGFVDEADLVGRIWWQSCTTATTRALSTMRIHLCTVTRW